MAAPPDMAALLEVFRRSVPREYHDPIAADDSYALFRGLAYVFAVLAGKAAVSTQARFYLPWSRQDAPPASSHRRASCVAQLRRRTLTTGGVTINAGEMILEVQGRRYFSGQTVRWEEGDPITLLRECVFVCEVPGTLGNLDFLGVDELLPERLYAIADQSQRRANIRARLYYTITSQLVLEDTGDPDVFLPTDVGLYVEILDSAYPSNVGLVFKIVGHDWPGTEHPVGSGYYPRRAFLDQYPRRNPQEVFSGTLPGPVYADLTAQALGGGALALLPVPGTAGDALYLLSAFPFSGAAVVLSVQGEGAWTASWEFWNGVAWVALPSVDDHTDALRIEPGEWHVRWGAVIFGTYVSPSSGTPWAAAVRVVLGAGPAITVSPVAARVLLFQQQPVVYDGPSPTSGGVSWKLLDFREVGVEVVALPPPAGGRDDDLMVLGDNRGVYQQTGESDESFRLRVSRLADVVSPDAIGAVVNNVLYPLGAEGVVCDVSLINSERGPATPSGGFDGFFWDKDPLDLYGPYNEFAVRTASTGPVPSPPANPQVVGGVAVDPLDLVLLKDQADPIENGVWETSLGFWSRVPGWGYAGEASGAGATAAEGDLAGTSWYCTSPPAADTIGVDPLTFAEPDPAQPSSPWVLLLSYRESFGFFFVLVPYLADGEFGFALDDGPIIPHEGLYLGPAWDEGAFDGYTVTAAGAYAAIYSAVDKIRAAGVGFTILRTPLLETP